MNYWLSTFSIASNNLPINERIRSARVFLIDQEGQQIGEIATSVALRQAYDAELDLVMVGPNANPPVVKILDYGKFKYEQDRKNRKNKAKKTQEVKEIRLTYNTGAGDLEVKLSRAKKFLAEGHKIKLRLRLVGREVAFKEKAVEQLDNFRNLLELDYEQPVQRQGRQLIALLKEKKS